MAVKIANRDARPFVKSRVPFQGNNLYGRTWMSNPSSIVEGDYGYAVFSYGEHWPLFAAVTLGGHTVWFENKDRHSVTTSKHRSQTHPHVDTVPLTQAEMIHLIAKGYTALARQRVVPAIEQTEFHQEVA
jgi:hypothetical protein